MDLLLLSASLSTKMCKGALWRCASEQVREDAEFNTILKMLSENEPVCHWQKALCHVIHTEQHKGAGGHDNWCH